MSTSHDPAEEHAPRLNETRARQGRWGQPVVWVLTISLTLAVIAVFATWAWHAHGLAERNSMTPPPSQVARFSAPPPQPRWAPDQHSPQAPG